MMKFGFRSNLVQGVSVVLMAATFASSQEAAKPVEVPNLAGVVLVKDPKDVVAAGISGVTGIKVDAVAPLDASDLRNTLSSYWGKPLTEALRTQIVGDIVLFYRSQNRPLVDVSLPPQELTSGVLQVLVLEGKVGAVRVEGGRWFNADKLAKQVRTGSGKDLDSSVLAQDLEWINRNPFRQVDLVYVKGSELGKTDLVLRTVDRFPLRFYAGYEDSGTALTGDNRLLGGLNWGNVFGGDGQLNYQYMADSRFMYFKAHSMSFIQPLPWRHNLTLFASYADTKAKVAPPFSLAGYNWQIGTRYEVPLPDIDSYRHAFVAGFDYKRANNNLAFGGVSVFGTATDTSQFSIGYNSSLRDRWGGTTFRGTLFVSPGGLGSANNKLAFQQSRAASSDDYVYGKVEMNRTTGLPYDFMWISLLTLQAANDNLLAGEQLGFGGYDSIRGYDTRVINADEGVIFTNELRTPSVGLLSRLHIKGLQDKFQLLGFLDYGVGRSVKRLVGENKTSDLLSAGPGLRYTISPYLSVRADYGCQLRQAERTRRHASRWHAGIVLSY